MANYNGQLNTNIITGVLVNMIISEMTFTDNIVGTNSNLVDAARVDGTLYGDTKIYIGTDVGKTYEWKNDAEAANLLKTFRSPLPKTQAIVMDVFRQIPLTIDNYLSKQAFGDEYSFAQFNGTLLGWMRITKRVYDSSTYNTFIGTNETSIGKQQVNIKLPTVAGNPEAEARLRAQTISKELANLFVDLQDTLRDYNDWEFLRSRDAETLMVVWNSEQVNEITNIDLPTIFHSDKLKFKFEEHILPARFFGTINASGGTTSSPNTTIRSLKEVDYNPEGMSMNDPEYDVKLHIFPGDLLPASTQYKENTTYTKDSKIICKVMDRRSVPFMSAFEVGTSFFNAKSLSENHYITWGHNKPEHIKQYPFVTVKVSEEKAAAAALKK